MPRVPPIGYSRWLRDEAANAGRENLDAEDAVRYDRKEDADAAKEVGLLRTLGLDRDSVVVEVGAGTGQFTGAVAEECAHVIAVDVSPIMLARLRTKAAAFANVTIVEAGFLTYKHEGPRDHGRRHGMEYSGQWQDQ